MENRNIVITLAPHVRRWFQDIAIAAARSLKELGHKCNVVASNKIDGFNSEAYDTVIVLAPHAYTELNMSLNFIKSPDKVYVGWCMEQTPFIDKTCESMSKNWQRALKYIDKFDFFFTESDVKTQYILNTGRQAFTASLGYHPHFTMYNKELENAPKQYDVFFVGAMYPRRTQIIQRLKELGLKIYPATSDFFDPIVKANAVKICKVGLNIHHNEIGYFEKPRIIQDYMSNKTMVVTETVDNAEDMVNKKHWVMESHDNLAETVKTWCTKPNSEREKIVDNAFEFIRTRYTMVDSMRNIVDVISNNWVKRIKKPTGERVIPNFTDKATEKQHRNRYEFFQSLAIEKTVLDVGCGAGYGTSMLANVASMAVGVDVDSSIIEHARSLYPLPKFGKGDIMNLPYGKGVFDLVYCFEVIEHVSDYKRALSEFSRVLKKQGKVIISTPNKRIVSSGSDIPKNNFHVKEWYMDEFIAEMKRNFRKVTTYGQHNVDPWSVHYEVNEYDLFFICVCTK